MIRCALAAFLALNIGMLYAQELSIDNKELIKNFIKCIKKGNKAEIARMASYPFRREYPIPNIKNEAEFVKRFFEVFDDTLLMQIRNSNLATDWSEMGWRGIMLFNGDVWLDFDGKLSGINYQPAKEIGILDSLIEDERKHVHESLSEFKSPVYILETSKFRIRIDDLGKGNYRYASWPIKKSMMEKPDLILLQGKFRAEGSGGNHSIIFKNGEYSYECSIIVMGEEGSPPAMLTIYKGEKEVLSQKANIVLK
jgi:hypothetical protein